MRPCTDRTSCRRLATFIGVLVWLSPATAWAKCDAGAIGEGEPIGYIERVDGPNERWTLFPGERPATTGRCVFRGDSLRRERETSAGSIIVVLYSGQPFKRNCRSEDCQGSIRIPEPAPARVGGLRALYGSFWKDGPPIPPIFVAARGIGDEPSPAVTVYQSGRLDLRHAVAAIAKGEHTFRLHQQLPPEGAEATFKMDLPSGVAVVPPLPAGVYSLEEIDDAGLAIGAAAAILVLQRPDPTAQALFDEVLDETRAWQSVDRSVIRSFITQAVIALQMRSLP